MKKNKIILILSIGAMILPIFSIQAVEKTTTPTTLTPSPVKLDSAKLDALRAKLIKETTTMKSSLDSSKTEIEKKITSNKDAVKVKLEAKSQEKIRIILEKIYDKFSSQTGKLTQVDIKISTKIDELSKAGLDMTASKAQYTIAKASLSKTNADILASRIVSMEQITKEITKETIRTLVKSSEASIKNTGEEYRKILPMMAQAHGNEKVENQNKTGNTN